MFSKKTHLKKKAATRFKGGIIMDSVLVPGHSKAVIFDREVIYVILKHTLPRVCW